MQESLRSWAVVADHVAVIVHGRSRAVLNVVFVNEWCGPGMKQNRGGTGTGHLRVLIAGVDRPGNDDSAFASAAITEIDTV